MIDRIAIISPNEALIIYTDRSAKRLSSDEDILTFVAWFVAEDITITYTEYQQSVSMMSEDTVTIKIAA